MALVLDKRFEDVLSRISANHIMYIVLMTVILITSATLPDALAQHPIFHGTQTIAGFHIELIVEPIPIEPHVLTKFSTTFMDAMTGEFAEEVPHTIVFIQDGEVIFSESTNAASHVHEFRFAEEHQGPLTVLIDNINNTGESIEYNLVVVPEFPLSAMFAMTAMLAITFAVLRFKRIRMLGR